MDGIRYIEELADVSIGPNGVKLCAHSGGENFCFRFERSLWRFFLEREIRALNEYERAERCERRVVGLHEGSA